MTEQMSEAAAIPPALSPEEWAQPSFAARETDGQPEGVAVRWTPDRLAVVFKVVGALGLAALPARAVHGVVAYLLNKLEIEGKPVCFTWEDVDDERKLAREVGRLADLAYDQWQDDGSDESVNRAGELREMSIRAGHRAAFIASLLPPRETMEKSNG